MKKILAVLGAFCLLIVFCSCEKKVEIAIPDDVTNQARALMLLDDLGVISLQEGIDINASVDDVVKNPYNIVFIEKDASAVADIIKDVDFAIVNSNYAIEEGINPAVDALAKEDFSSVYSNIVAVRKGETETPQTKVLVAALESYRVSTFVKNTYNGTVVSQVKNPGDGYAPDVDYKALEGTVIKVAATPKPHGEMLKVAKDLLAKKNITLEITELSDYSAINDMLVKGEVDANFFQHSPYMDNYNETHGTSIVSAGKIHIEPMGIYSDTINSIDDIK